MFTARYFNPRFWASRFWAKVGAAPITPTKFCEITSNNESPTAASNNITIIRSDLCQ